MSRALLAVTQRQPRGRRASWCRVCWAHDEILHLAERDSWGRVLPAASHFSGPLRVSLAPHPADFQSAVVEVHAKPPWSRPHQGLHRGNSFPATPGPRQRPVPSPHPGSKAGCLSAGQADLLAVWPNVAIGRTLPHRLAPSSAASWFRPLGCTRAGGDRVTPYSVEPIPRSPMAVFVAAHPCAVRVPPHCLLSVGCFVGSDLVGVASWGYGVRPRHAIQRVFPMACHSRIPRATSTGSTSACPGSEMPSDALVGRPHCPATSTGCPTSTMALCSWPSSTRWILLSPCSASSKITRRTFHG